MDAGCSLREYRAISPGDDLPGEAPGYDVVLVYNEFWREGPYRRTLEKIAHAEKVPLVDSSTLLFDARQSIEAEVEAKLQLQPANEAAYLMARKHCRSFLASIRVNASCLRPSLS